MDAEGWLTSELASFSCAACGRAYGEGHVRLIAQRAELCFVDLSCRHCGSQAVAIVTIQVEGEAAELVTRAAGPGAEGDPPGASPSASPAAIGVDDVLDVHDLLAGFDGDVHDLLARFDGEGA
jgi:hypothetical protein